MLIKIPFITYENFITVNPDRWREFKLSARLRPHYLTTQIHEHIRTRIGGYIEGRGFVFSMRGGMVGGPHTHRISDTHEFVFGNDDEVNRKRLERAINVVVGKLVDELQQLTQKNNTITRVILRATKYTQTKAGGKLTLHIAYQVDE